MMRTDRKTLTRELEHLLEGADQLAGEGLPVALQRVVDAVAPLLRAQGAGIMLADEHEVLRPAAASGGPGRRLATAEERLGAGPAQDSYAYDLPVTSSDLTIDARWPDLRHLVDRSAVRAVLAAPLSLPQGGPIGALCVYTSRAREWEVAEISASLAYAGVVASLIAVALEARLRGVLLDRLLSALRGGPRSGDPYDG
jgi:GAF domain-containing protein